MQVRVSFLEGLKISQLHERFFPLWVPQRALWERHEALWVAGLREILGAGRVEAALAHRRENPEVDVKFVITLDGIEKWAL